MDVGVFIPIANNGWLISKTSPQYMPSFDLNRRVVQKAEAYGMNFALSMVKLRGFGGESEFWDHALDSFTLMAGIAAVTSKIKLFASVAIPTCPPALIARQAVTIDSIAPGRFGVNIVSGWHVAEYSQMGLWPGDDYFRYRYDYASEYVRVMNELWSEGRSDFKGSYFRMDDCRLSPRPVRMPEIVGAGQSDRGMEFVATYGNYNFCFGKGVNTPTAHSDVPARLMRAAAKTGRDVGTYALFMVIADETDDAAMAKWQSYRAGADLDALAWMAAQSATDSTASVHSTATHMNLPEGAVNFNMGTIVGSYATVARLLDEAATVPGTKGLMLTFDEFLIGMDQFGQRIQPLMRSRADVSGAT
ncbi:pyrimidine oxygenase [Arboricoccus pini]|uniref:Pyrimidine monooxygenase RutA n=1 Tax=Arboricoccus pini TaxID=1963835 RepID=A0A212R779_9PROT|nr:pyrimidine utilization protein A [Arboricoccus pini]SNB68046.1 pyrimidine oxygenase [Arboricoccus pini]